jgi:hypothetical protein
MTRRKIGNKQCIKLNPNTMSSYNFKKTPMEKVLHAFNRLGKDEFHKYIYDYGDVLLEEEEDMVKAYRNDTY